MKKDIVIMDTAIIWYRQDLRLADNPALVEACKHGKILPIYIFDTTPSKNEQLGAASKCWLHYALESLKSDFDGNLSFYSGPPLEIFKDLLSKYNISAVYWNRLYDANSIKRDTEIKAFLKEQNIEAESFNGSLLWEPWSIKKADGTPYKVFTPYYRRGCLNGNEPRDVYAKPDFKHGNKSNSKGGIGVGKKIIKDKESLPLEKLNLLPEIPWFEKMKKHWDISEKGAIKNLNLFIENALHDYKDGRNFPARPFTSKLSPYLHFGQISPQQIWQALKFLPEEQHDENMDCFCSELGWREFSYSLLFYNKDLQVKNLRERFDNFEWLYDEEQLLAWQKGQTGIPIIDAGMRELWQTGYIHNRVRMLVGSFLVKNLRLHWHHGERWFWDCLLDADLASNSASWQWIAGCGADAAPYFRIFNPVTQSEKFDSEGSYIRKYIPEIAKLTNKYLTKPWTAPAEILKEANIELGKTYPKPIVDLKASRQEALDAFKQI